MVLSLTPYDVVPNGTPYGVRVDTMEFREYTFMHVFHCGYQLWNTHIIQTYATTGVKSVTLGPRRGTASCQMLWRGNATKRVTPRSVGGSRGRYYQACRLYLYCFQNNKIGTCTMAIATALNSTILINLYSSKSMVESRIHLLEFLNFKIPKKPVDKTIVAYTADRCLRYCSF